MKIPFALLLTTAVAIPLGAAAVGCSDDETPAGGTTPTATSTTTSPPAEGGTTPPADSGGNQTRNICLTVGDGDPAKGAAGVDGVIDQFIGKVVADCAINQYFTVLQAAQVKHLDECLKIQVKELLGCPGFTYAGSKDTAGVACRDMKAAHVGLGITEPDYDALVADLLAVTPDAVKSHPDFANVAGVLIAPKNQDGTVKNAVIENKASTTLGKSACDGGAPEGGT